MTSQGWTWDGRKTTLRAKGRQGLPSGPDLLIFRSVDKLLNVLYEDARLLVVNKPAGLVCHPTKTDVYSSLISRVRLYLGPGSHPHLINRLDRETSGVTIVAKDEVTAGRLGKLWENRAVSKHYLAVVHSHVIQQHGLIDAPLGKDIASRVAIKDCVLPDGASARTQYEVLRRFTRPHSAPVATDSPRTAAFHSAVPQTSRPQPFSLLRLTPLTGRKHQIRIHLSHIGHPIVGDKLYGADEELYLAFVEGRLTPAQQQQLLLPHQALHAEQVSFLWKGTMMDFTAQPEHWFSAFTERS